MVTSSLISRITHHLLTHPQKVVVYDDERSWTWQELMAEAKNYADAIWQYAKNDDIIPIIVDRSGRSVAAMLGCILAGKCFANISNELPLLRIEQCILKTESKCCIDVSGLHSEQINSFCFVLNKLAGNPNEKQSGEITQNKLLYVLFTSGSSGDPKAVKVSASNIENTMLWSLDMIDWQPSDIMGCASQFSFDISMFDVFTLFYFNVPLVIFSNVKDYRSVLDQINQYNVTSIFSVPQFFSSLLVSDINLLKEKSTSLRRIISGGDFFNPVHLLQWATTFNRLAIYNVWGPTETSIVNTMHQLDSNDVVRLKEGQLPSIGCAHSKMPLVLLNENRTEKIDKPLEQGEIVMLGDCVTEGYLNDSQLTAAKYGFYNGQRCFYTEDIAYQDENGNLFMVGRIGSMVKIAGYRVDLNEIEFVTAGFDNIKQCCCVVAISDISEKQLHLFCTLQDVSNSISIYALKNYLRQYLPNYMIPKMVHIIESMPMNNNQKIDRKRLSTDYLNKV